MSDLQKNPFFGGHTTLKYILTAHSLNFWTKFKIGTSFKLPCWSIVMMLTVPITSPFNDDVASMAMFMESALCKHENLKLTNIWTSCNQDISTSINKVSYSSNIKRSSKLYIRIKTATFKFDFLKQRGKCRSNVFSTSYFRIWITVLYNLIIFTMNYQ